MTPSERATRRRFHLFTTAIKEVCEQQHAAHETCFGSKQVYAGRKPVGRMRKDTQEFEELPGWAT
eukprot:9100030-Prorocentrum_lima.AAC.1